MTKSKHYFEIIIKLTVIISIIIGNHATLPPSYNGPASYYRNQPHQRINKREINPHPSIEYLNDCCEKVVVKSSGSSSNIQWDRMGTYVRIKDIPLLHGRFTYKHESLRQYIYYIYRNWEGWMLGPKEPQIVNGTLNGSNFGGIKNNLRTRCVHTTSFGWEYFAAPENLSDPLKASKYWKSDDSTLDVRCAPKHTTLVIDRSTSSSDITLYKYLDSTDYEPMGTASYEITCSLSCDTLEITLSNGENGVLKDVLDIFITPSQFPMNLEELNESNNEIKMKKTTHNQEIQHTFSSFFFHRKAYIYLAFFTDHESSLIMDLKIDGPNILEIKSIKY